MKILYLALFPLLLTAQQLQPVTSQQADCGKFAGPFFIAGTFVSAQVDNRQAGCDGWVVTYSSNGFGTVSVLLQDAPLSTGGIAGSFVSFAGTIVSGPNPAVITTQSEIIAKGYFPYVRVQVTTTGTGYLQLEFHGFKTNPNSGSGAAGGGCPGTVGTPCVVDGPTAAGSPPTTAPVLVAGQDGTNIQTLKTGSGTDNLGTITNTQGEPQVMLMLADPAGAAGASVQAAVVEGTGDGVTGRNSLQVGQNVFTSNAGGYDRVFACPNQVLVTLADATLTAVVTVSGATKIRVCSAHFTTSGAAETVSLLQGTGVACAGAPVTIDAWLGVTAFTQDYSPSAALRTAASNGLCVQQSGAAQAAKVWVSYAQF